MGQVKFTLIFLLCMMQSSIADDLLFNDWLRQNYNYGDDLIALNSICLKYRVMKSYPEYIFNGCENVSKLISELIYQKYDEDQLKHKNEIEQKYNDFKSKFGLIK